jgi:hypothetical protein
MQCLAGVDVRARLWPQPLASSLATKSREKRCSSGKHDPRHRCGPDGTKTGGPWALIFLQVGKGSWKNDPGYRRRRLWDPNENGGSTGRIIQSEICQRMRLQTISSPESLEPRRGVISGMPTVGRASVREKTGVKRKLNTISGIDRGTPNAFTLCDPFISSARGRSGWAGNSFHCPLGIRNLKQSRFRLGD